MPVELRVETEGKTEIKKVDVVAPTRNMSLTPSAGRATSASIRKIGS